MPLRKIIHLTVPERVALGKDGRAQAPRSSHEGWVPAADRPDPIALIEQQNATREPDLVPVRHGRMLVSPFSFYRGAAKIMAADLKHTPRSGLITQLCGDAHLSNFGVFASPERNLLFDLNDFDETLPGPFEYDVLRMGASFTVAARNNGFSDRDAQAVTIASVRAYREAMAEFAAMRTMDVWYARLSEDELNAALSLALSARKSRTGTETQKKSRSKDTRKQDKAESSATSGIMKAAERGMAKARTRDSLQALAKLGEYVDGRYRIRSQPPIVIPVRDLENTDDLSADETWQAIHAQLRSYRVTLQHDRRHLLERFDIIDVARKVVGVGSVGTRSYIALLQGRDENDPLFLQVKEATASVLEDHLPASRYRQAGERVVQGQRLMQAASDIYLGWTRGVDENRFMYWRQLRDMKGSADVEAMTPSGLTFYAGLCGWTLARAHARAGDPVAITAYLGRNDRFDRSVTDFCERYADQNERDYQAFVEAVSSGRLQAIEGV